MNTPVSIDLMKPLTKLVDVIANAIGVLYEPHQLVRIAHAEAKADRIKVIEHAKTEAILANDIDKYSQLSAIEKRMVIIEQKRQANIMNIIGVATQLIKNEKDITSEPVNPDWATRFFDISQDISDEAMQNLWGRILAGETKQPGSYSLRTLDTLRNISPEEAALFEEMANFVLYNGSHFIFNGSYHKLEQLGIMYYKIATLIEAGLVQPGSTVRHHFYIKDNKPTNHYMSYANYIVEINQPTNLPTLSMPIYILTQMGQEIYGLIEPKPNLEYLALIAQYLKKNDDLRIHYAPIESIDANGDVHYKEESLVDL